MLYYYFVNLHPGNFVKLPAPDGWKKKVSKETGEKYYLNEITKQKTIEYPMKYKFLEYNGLIKYFGKTPSNIIKIFNEFNVDFGIVLLNQDSSITRQRESEGKEEDMRQSESGGGGVGPSESEGGYETILEDDTTDNARYEEEDAKGGRRKRKSKKRKSNKRKRTRKARTK